MWWVQYFVNFGRICEIFVIIRGKGGGKLSAPQGIIQKKSAFGSQTLPFVIFDAKVPFLPKVMLF